MVILASFALLGGCSFIRDFDDFSYVEDAGADVDEDVGETVDAEIDAEEDAEPDSEADAEPDADSGTDADPDANDASDDADAADDGDVDPPPDPRRYVQLAMGTFTNCARTAEGEVDCWGSYSPGGDDAGDRQWMQGRTRITGNQTELRSPAAVSALHDTVDVATSGTLACAVDDDRLKCWGLLAPFMFAHYEPAPLVFSWHPVEIRTPAKVQPVIDVGITRLPATPDVPGMVCVRGGDPLEVMCAYGDREFALGAEEDSDSDDGFWAKPTNVPPGEATALVVGETTGCAVVGDDAGLVCWGQSGFLSHGGPETINTGRDVLLTGGGRLSNVTDVVIGPDRTCAVSGGDLYCWGDLTGIRGVTPGVTRSATLVYGDGETALEVEQVLIHQSSLSIRSGSELRRLTQNGAEAELPFSDIAQMEFSLVDLPLGPREPVRENNGLVACILTNAEAELPETVMCAGENRWGQQGTGDDGNVTDLIPPMNYGLMEDRARFSSLAPPITRTMCDGEATDVMDDPEHCGRCNNSCDGAACNGGFCDGRQPVATANATTCALSRQGDVSCWGRGSFGELGNGSSTALDDDISQDSAAPLPVTIGAGGSMNDVLELRASQRNICANRRDGVWCWGHQRNVTGYFGGEGFYRATRLTQFGDTRVDDFGLGVSFICVLRDGQVLCDGTNSAGQIGGARVEGAPNMVEFPVGVRIARLAVDEASTCALSTRGEVYCWGSNASGELGKTLPVMESEDPVRVMLEGDEIVDLVATGRSFCALTDANDIHCWGNARLMQHFGHSAPEPEDPIAPQRVFTNVVGSRLSSHQSGVCIWVSPLETACSGAPTSGRIGDGGPNSRAAPVPFGRVAQIEAGMFWERGRFSHHVTLGFTGIAWGWGRNDREQVETFPDPGTPNLVLTKPTIKADFTGFAR